MTTRQVILSAAERLGELRGASLEEAETGVHVPVLCYHRFLPNWREPGLGVYNAPPRRFAEHMALLRELRFETLSLDDYRAMADGRVAPPPRAVVVTVDDGYADFLRAAWPVARRQGVRLNLFVLTSVTGRVAPVEKRTPALERHLANHPRSWRMLDWGELRRLRDLGIGLGLHGFNHERLSEIPPDRLRLQTGWAMDDFARELGFRPLDFAIPYGCPGSFTAEALDVLAGLGLERIFSTINGRLRLPQSASAVPIPRHAVDGDESTRLLRMRLFGACDWLGPVKQAAWFFTVRRRR